MSNALQQCLGMWREQTASQTWLHVAQCWGRLPPRQGRPSRQTDHELTKGRVHKLGIDVALILKAYFALPPCCCARCRPLPGGRSDAGRGARGRVAQDRAKASRGRCSRCLPALQVVLRVARRRSLFRAQHRETEPGRGMMGCRMTGGGPYTISALCDCKFMSLCGGVTHLPVLLRADRPCRAIVAHNCEQPLAGVAHAAGGAAAARRTELLCSCYRARSRVTGTV
jgi:hypothetical protein